MKMGNLYSTVWPSKKESKLYVTATAKKHTVLTAVDDIQKLTPEQMVEQFENVCRASQRVLRSLTHNPCGQLSLCIKQCLDENFQQMSKCFAVMDDYRACVNKMMSEKLADVVIDFEKYAEDERNGSSYDILPEDGLLNEEDCLRGSLEKELKRRVEELNPKTDTELRTEQEECKQKQERLDENENEDINTCA
ncbi:uncharacterized protein LOC128859399 [Anastrepha ludens]|uniref:uncharacterized protein LOC128859399 n=1 Tax=Anastrepha ludens TaxID=28586 RepID=UPI0023AF3CE2|nr:uncharacterized protein LOC128859399 [Anastrepha ludens]